MSKRVCIIANSPEFDGDSVRAHAAGADSIIAADGAIAQLPPDIIPHVVCGDFDSHPQELYSFRYPTTEWIEVADQESNDLEKCISLAIARGATEILIVCGWGGRLDQALTTLSVMERYHGVVPIVLHHGAWSCRRLSDEGGLAECEIEAAKGETVSLVPQVGEVEISLSNVRWPLRHEVLRPGSRGVSNEALGGVVRVAVHRGSVLLCHEKRAV